MKWQAVRAIVRKDITEAVKNMYVLFCLVLPVGLSVLFGVILPDLDEVSILKVAAHDPGGSRLVTALGEQAEVEILSVESEEELVSVVEEEAVGGVAVPVGFDAAVEAGEQPELSVYVNSERGGRDLAAFRRVIQKQLWAMVGQTEPAHITWTDLAAEEERLGLEERLASYFLVLLLVMALCMTGAFVVPTLMVEEKEKRTLQYLLVSPAGPREVVAGKALTGLAYSVLIAGILIALDEGWAGDWPVTVLAVLLGALFLNAVGLLMGSLFHTTTQVNTWSSIVMLGFLVPGMLGLGHEGEHLEILLRVIPTHYLVEILSLALAGEGYSGAAWLNLAVLFGCSCLALAAVVWRLRTEETW